MAEQQLDEGLGYLDAFVTDLGVKEDAMEEKQALIEAFNAELKELKAELEEAKNHVIETVEQRLSSLEDTKTQALEAVDGVKEEAEECATALAEKIQSTIEERKEQLVTKAEESAERIVAGFTSLADQGFQLTQEAVDGITSRVEELSQRTQDTFDQLGSKVQDFTSSCVSTAETTQQVFSDVFENVTGNFTELRDTAFSTFTEAAGSIGGDIEGTFEQLNTDVNAGFENLFGVMVNLGDQLTERAAEIVSDTIQLVADEVQTRIQAEFERVVVEAVEGLITDFGVSAAMMAAGSAVTAAISPYVPALAAAKSAVQVINDLLDALNPFD